MLSLKNSYVIIRVDTFELRNLNYIPYSLYAVITLTRTGLKHFPRKLQNVSLWPFVC